VVSVAVKGQAVIDAGTKALGREPLRAEGDGYGALLDHPEVVVSRMSEEHGILDLSKTAWRPRLGDQVRVVPNHVCIVVHLFDEIIGVRGHAVETRWAVEARGRGPALDERADLRTGHDPRHVRSLLRGVALAHDRLELRLAALVQPVE
jgi:hypothetical protein